MRRWSGRVGKIVAVNEILTSLGPRPGRLFRRTLRSAGAVAAGVKFMLALSPLELPWDLFYLDMSSTGVLCWNRCMNA